MYDGNKPPLTVPLNSDFFNTARRRRRWRRAGATSFRVQVGRGGLGRGQVDGQQLAISLR